MMPERIWVAPDDYASTPMGAEGKWIEHNPIEWFINGVKQNPHEYLQADLVRELVDAQRAYIDLLCEEIDEIKWIAYSHGWESSRFKQGKEARQRIFNARKLLGLEVK